MTSITNIDFGTVHKAWYFAVNIRRIFEEIPSTFDGKYRTAFSPWTDLFKCFLIIVFFLEKVKIKFIFSFYIFVWESVIGVKNVNRNQLFIFFWFLSKNVYFSLAFLWRKNKIKSDFIPHLSHNDESYKTLWEQDESRYYQVSDF